MKFIETIFLGFLIACTSLIAQVFFEVIAEIFFHSDITIKYSITDTTGHTILIMFIAATIEESIRYLFIKKRTVQHINNTLLDPLFYGTLLGIGFVTLEIIFSYLNNALFTTPLISILTVVSIHIILSIFLLYISARRYSFSQDFPFIVIAILLHVCGNFLLLQYI